MPKNKTNEPLGSIAWEAYRQKVGRQSLNRQPLPPWNTLVNDPSKAQVVEGWNAAAEAVAESLGKAPAKKKGKTSES